MGFRDLKSFIPLVVLAAWGWSMLRSSWRNLALGLALFTSALVEIPAYVMLKHGESNIGLYNAYLLVQMPLMGLLAMSLMKDGRVRSAAWMVMGVGVGIWLTDHYGRSSNDDFLAGSALLNSAMTIILMAVVLVLQATTSLRPVQHDPGFWVALSCVLFHGASLPLNGLIAYLSDRNPALASDVYLVNDIAYVMHYGIIMGGLVIVAPRYEPRPADE